MADFNISERVSTLEGSLQTSRDYAMRKQDDIIPMATGQCNIFNR